MKKRFLAAGLLLVLVLCTGCASSEYEISVVVPAGSTGEEICWSEEEISPRKDHITLSGGEQLWDCAVSLLPTQVQEERSYVESQYLTKGTSVKMEAEKGGWFRVGVSAINDTQQDRTIEIRVNPVDVRIQ